MQDYVTGVIKSYRNRSLRDFWTKGRTRGINPQWIAKLNVRMAALSVARTPEDMNLPGYHFHGLQGVDRYSVRVTHNYRLTFAWDGEDAIEVDLEDYH
ncbi:type II toxin-antitoxin system RelE/ParE family toxin [Minwuia sp.]|uniref:type II toxin-antitoxin system RelE/ParE family toxin n=1 Tax=Minwuia sp. TaxID=2493630 RepID=UPI003A933866